MLRLILVIILVLLLIGALPNWPYSSSWGFGYYPSGLLFILLIIVIIVFFVRGTP